MKPICVECRRFFRPKKNGFPFIENMPKHNHALPGAEDPASWTPYKLWMADLWECKGCGIQIVVGAGRQPIAEQHEPDFAATVQSYNATLQVNDC